MKANPVVAIIAVAYVLVSCTSGEKRADTATSLDPMIHAILEDTTSFYYVDVHDYPTDETLPIGIFDSGTGGLTVMDALVRYDAYDNESQLTGGDGHPDFSKEQFIYLADQANMPYGNYYSERKSDLLVEHVLKDAQFLLSEKYYPDASAVNFVTGKQRVKAIVIACNTATAYAKEDVEALIQESGLDIPVIGVIDAGARGVLDVFEKDEDGAIGVFATVGTIASKGYERTIMEWKDRLGYRGDIQIYNQGGYGVAEAVDREPGFISSVADQPREDYLGPSFNHGQYPIEKALMDSYRFDFSGNKMLCGSRGGEDCNVLQINSADNYIRYHLVSLLEQLRTTAGAHPLKALVLGCTHYPYLTGDIRRTLDELYAYQRDGEYVYRHVMAPEIQLIDPAENVAAELHSYLAQNAQFNPSGSVDSSEFYIAVPNMHNNEVQTDGKGHFTYAYKYGRNVGEIQEYVKVVPFSKANIPAETLGRMGEQIPETFGLIRTFSNTSDKTVALPAVNRIR
ncbi:glutamate racemase [Parapedobacter sp.]